MGLDVSKSADPVKSPVSAKRPADDEEQPPAQRRRLAEPEGSLVIPQDPSLEAVLSLAQLCAALTERSNEARDGSVQLTGEEVQRLATDIESTVQSFLDKPATTKDMLRLLGELRRVLPLPSPASQSPRAFDAAEWLRSFGIGQFSRDRARSPPGAPSTPALATDPSSASAPDLAPASAPALPVDIIALVLEQLQDKHAESPKAKSRWGESGELLAWRELRKLGCINRAWAEVCFSRYRSELHVSTPYLNHASFLRQNPVRAEALTKLYIRVLDFDVPGSRANPDDGFSLPTLISNSPSLTTLSIDSNKKSPVRSLLRRPAADSFSSYIGGFDLPALICSKVPKLRTLIYGAPCNKDDILAFTTQLPDLRSLDIVGEVDTAPPSSVFRPCVPTLRRFWAPDLVLTATQLDCLVASSTSLVSALAFTFDLDDYLASQPATPEQVAEKLQRLEKLFEKIGSRLRELLLASPMSDLAPGLSRGVRPGGGGAATNVLAMHVVVGGPAAGPPPAPPAAATNAAPAPVNPAPAAPPRAQAAAGANPNRNNPFQFFFPNAAASSPPTAFFEIIIAHTPRLYHLELYGRRYTAGLIETLKLLDQLEHLSLSVPDDDEREATATEILNWMTSLPRRGSEPAGALRRLELSARGGEWDPKERRRIKEACEDRIVAYASTDV